MQQYTILWLIHANTCLCKYAVSVTTCIKPATVPRICPLWQTFTIQLSTGHFILHVGVHAHKASQVHDKRTESPHGHFPNASPSSKQKTISAQNSTTASSFVHLSRPVHSFQTAHWLSFASVKHIQMCLSINIHDHVFKCYNSLFLYYPQPNKKKQRLWMFIYTADVFPF